MTIAGVLPKLTSSIESPDSIPGDAITAWAYSAVDLPGVRKVIEITKKYGNYEETLGNPMYPHYMYMVDMVYAMAMVEGLKNAGRNLTPETLVEGLEKIKDLDMGGLVPNLTFGPKRHVSSFSSGILIADGKKKRFEILDPIKAPKLPIE